MKIMVVGGGGREHAIINKLLENKSLEKIYWVGAKFKEGIFNVEVLDLDALDFPSLVSFVRENSITYTIVGPELPLTEGIVDHFAKEGLPIFGPCQLGAKLEGSKTFAKEIMMKYGVPTAKYVEIENIEHGQEIIEKWGTPIVFKVDGLAQGKGVVIPSTKDEAIIELGELLEKHPNQKVFAEEYFVGTEVSYMALVSKNKFVPLVPSRDYKRIGVGNTGPNTGGMGSVASKDILTIGETTYIDKEIISKTLDGLKTEGIEFTGILYAGLMMTDQGPKVLEFNTRFGDPEAQSILELLETDLAEVLLQASKGSLPQKLEFADETALTLVLSSGGYPGDYNTGITIDGLHEVTCKAYQAGTEHSDGKVVTAGGRVINLTTRGKDIDTCRQTLYNEQQKVTFLGKYFRNDIGL